MKSFPKIWALGSKQVPDILKGRVEITEKMDGSQFGFGKNEWGELKIRSKGQWIDIENPPALFRNSVDWVVSIQDTLNPDSFYYGEAITSNRHNTLRYDRTPKGYVCLFAAGDYQFIKVVNEYSALTDIAATMGCEVVPLVFEGEILAQDIPNLIDKESGLGGPDMEGVVVKRYEPYEYMGRFIPVQCGKFVSEKFKEKHSKNKDFMSGKSRMQMYFEEFATEARWRKAVEHLRDNNELTNSPKDIGILLKELHQDLDEEYKQEIMEHLWKFYKKDVYRAITNGFPQWYKERLLQNLS